MNVKEYWNERILEKGKYSSIGHQGYGEKTNKKRKESLFPLLDQILSREFSNIVGKSVLDIGCGTGIYSNYKKN
jgi:2-polyprenyl-3-methyl-5-hydroxy-6-metoxy-1,4-benzoquinol methylase